ncbi:cbb3-type cytochrome oxidase assembly protein CcoS [Maribrevibacterium harenarium]|uniref:Cbb3-type cytochrome oxidase assembly protein CcoS n=1 Tax=Maribrevibacterium harenarium TaxID=2589817 RepID=A0A501X4V6_9GAMM|nr:cbb3-type cytochrome oxidase assembly protein CcoS [Maribrevibacterium harenarium]TPE55552.1 cbb3-type cytochrome oxidase assembly protein CcoS [Maribrevibacterium harenarium]
MESLFILVPLATLFVIVAVSIFIWAVRRDQFEDLNHEGERILFEEDDEEFNSSKKSKR